PVSGHAAFPSARRGGSARGLAGRPAPHRGADAARDRRDGLGGPAGGRRMSVTAVMPLSTGHLAYDVRGPADAPSLVLLRPAGGSMALWGRFREILAESLRVVSFDPRGQGRSSRAPLWWSVEDMVEDAIQLLDLLDIDQSHLFGLSLGGMVALRMAIAHPERIDRLVIASARDHGGLSPRGPGVRSVVA